MADTVTKYRTEEIMAKIRAGQLVAFDRRAGHTTAICRVVHEDHDGAACVLLPTVTLAAYFERAYRELYSTERRPLIYPAYSAKAVERALRGHSLPVYVDTFGLFPDEARIWLYDNHIKFAGVA